jgi:hypothetical protein
MQINFLGSLFLGVYVCVFMETQRLQRVLGKDKLIRLRVCRTPSARSITFSAVFPAKKVNSENEFNFKTRFASYIFSAS